MYYDTGSTRMPVQYGAKWSWSRVLWVNESTCFTQKSTCIQIIDFFFLFYYRSINLGTCIFIKYFFPFLFWLPTRYFLIVSIIPVGGAVPAIFGIIIIQNSKLKTEPVSFKHKQKVE